MYYFQYVDPFNRHYKYEFERQITVTKNNRYNIVLKVEN